MSEKFESEYPESSLDKKTMKFAENMGILPNTKVYRYLHPVMICGKEKGKILLRGLRSNGVAVDDLYRGKQRAHASSLDNPGLNFTKEKLSHYRNSSRRALVSLTMADQPRGLQIYPDRGSEIDSVYFTLPEGEFFKVDAVDVSAHEQKMAIRLHDIMKKIGMKDEPYLSYRATEIYVSSYIPSASGIEVYVETAFHKNAEGEYELQTLPNDTNLNIEMLEELAITRFLIEHLPFRRIISTNGTEYKSSKAPY